jgi:hypothetical protein
MRVRLLECAPLLSFPPDLARPRAETARVFAAERLRTEQNKLRTQLGYMKKMLDGDAIPKYQVRIPFMDGCTNQWLACSLDFRRKQELQMGHKP